MAKNQNILIGLKLKDIDDIKSKLQRDIDKLGKKLNLNISKVELQDIDKISNKIQRQLNQISKQVTLNIKNIQLGNADKVLNDLNRQIKQSLSNQDIKINPTTNLKSVKGNFDEILKSASKAREEIKLVNGELAKMSTVVDKNGAVKSTTLSYKYDEARQAIEKYGWVAKEEGGKVVKQFDLISRKLVDNKEKAENSFKAQEKYLDSLAVKLSKVKDLAEKRSRTNENYDNSNELKNIAELQNRINEIKKNGITITEEEKNLLNRSVLEIDNLIKKESDYAAEINKSTTFLEKQITTLQELKEKLSNSSIGNKEQVDQLNTELEKQILAYQKLIEENEILGNVEKNRIQKSTNEMKAQTNEITSYSNKISSMVKDIAGFAIGGGATVAALTEIKQGLSEIVSVDDQMRDLKKVTNETNQEYESFKDKANATAVALGNQTENVIAATAAFAQMSYSYKDAQELAKNAIIYQNVGDMSQEEATKGLIATMKAFNMNAKDSMEIMDKANEVSNRYAISVQGINDALTRGGSALHVAGNDLSQTISLITAANSAIQDQI